jgi:hypothetical protein
MFAKAVSTDALEQPFHLEAGRAPKRTTDDAGAR